MFHTAIAFNQPLVWDTSKVTNISNMFYNATAWGPRTIQSYSNLNQTQIDVIKNIINKSTNVGVAKRVAAAAATNVIAKEKQQELAAAARAAAVTALDTCKNNTIQKLNIYNNKVKR